MLIWGSKGRERETGQGLFYCPKCNDLRPYKQKRVSKHFTLYFIPLFETKKLGEYVECQVCKSGFDPKILEPDTQSLFQLVGATRGSLLQGMGIEAVKAQLEKYGMSEETALQVIKMAQG